MNNYRKLSIKELYHGIYVQINPKRRFSTEVDFIYKLIFEEGKFFYTTDGRWKMDSTLMLDNWYETDKTIEMNRECKLKEIGI